MNRIDHRFKQLKQENRKALIAYVTGGFPSLWLMEKAIKDLERAGVDLIEIGVPFSDPIADGPTIQYSSTKALEKRISLSQILKWVAAYRKRSQIPIVLMSYLNPIHKRGFQSFSRMASISGVDGLIVPDLIPEESAPLEKALKTHGIKFIYLVAPTTPPKRRRWLAQKSGGFLYAVSITGVTGARKTISKETLSFLKDLKKTSKVPVAVGFGISGPEQVRTFSSLVDGVIVGSALINRLKDKKPLLPFAKSLRKALDKK